MGREHFIAITVTIKEPGKEEVVVPMHFNPEFHDLDLAIDQAVKMVKSRIQVLAEFKDRENGT